MSGTTAIRAAVQWEPGGVFDVTTVELAPPGPGEVRVRLRAAGVCATDLTLTTAFGHPTPVVLGHEGAGVVTEVGPGVRSVGVGDHVIALWVPSCHECLMCRRGHEHLCARRRSSAQLTAAAGPPALSVGGRAVVRGMGTATFADETVLPENGVAVLDRDVPFPVAAMLGCAIPTGFGAAVRSARVQVGDEVVVIGCGPVGLAAVLGAVVAGAARITAVDPHPARQQLALQLGATDAMSPGEIPSREGGPDVVIDAVGNSRTIRTGYDTVRRGGTVTVVGAGKPGDTLEFSAYELFHDDKRLTGSWLGDMSLGRDLPVLTDLWRSGRLPVERLIDGTADLADIGDVVADQTSGAVLRTLLVS